MSYRIIHINSKLTKEETILGIAEKFPIEQFWQIDGKQGMKNYNMLVDTDMSQSVLDALTSVTGHDNEAKIIVTPVEAVLPKDSKEKEEEKKRKKKSINRGISREELYEDVKAGAELSSNYIESEELISRTTVEMNAILLALASGAAGVLSLTSGVSSVLVGVMVAVALLPPAVVAGLTFGNGNYNLAFGALILLFVNVVCINIAANLVLLFKGVAPKSWYKKDEAKKKMAAYMTFWVLMLAGLSAVVYYKNNIFDGDLKIKYLSEKFSE